MALRFVAVGAMALARRAPRPPQVEARLALANLHRPGAPTPSVVISLGLGLAVIVALALVDVNMRDQLHPLADGADAEFLFRRRAQHRRRAVPRISGARSARREDRRGADDARPDRQDRRRRGGRLPRQGERAMGAGGRSRRDLRRCAAAGLDGRRGRLVGQGLQRAAARLARIRHRRRARAEDRRRPHRQCARPQRDGEDRQHSQGQLAQLRDQFRAGVFARRPSRARPIRCWSPPCSTARRTAHRNSR